ncbi:MAG: 50S ribosomal protein L9 [Patescibacteria group bacterium]
MKVILLKDVPKLGRQYEVKEVKPGYARNFILARGLGAMATKITLAQADFKRQGREAALIEKRERLAKEASELEKVTIRLTRRANDLGHLFDGLDANDLIKALRSQTNFDLESDWIALPRPIKELGTHTIPVSHGETKTSFQLIVEPEADATAIKKAMAKKRSPASPIAG